MVFRQSGVEWQGAARLAAMLIAALLLAAVSGLELHAAMPDDLPRPGATAVGLVTDVGTLADKGYNWLSYQGVLRAEDELGVVGTVYTSTGDADYLPNLQQCADDGNDLCISVGFLMQDATWLAAQNNPGTNFAIVDISWDDYPPNLRGIAFATSEAAYLGGTLAALMTESDVLGVIGGMDIPPVNDFVVGFRNGARCANDNVHVPIRYAGDFANPGLGAQIAQELIAQGADVIFPPAGGTGVGALLTATQSSVWAMGVDVDQYIQVFGNGAVPGADKMLTSVMKRMDNAVYDTIASAVAGQFKPGTGWYNLKVGGVGLAPFHEADPAVPLWVRGALAAVEQGIVDGTIDVTDPCWLATRYVDGKSGSDDSACRDPDDPCRTVGYALGQSELDDTILVAQGTYTENVKFGQKVSLYGGYEADGWTRDVGLYETILDGSGSPSLPGDWDGLWIYAPVVLSDTGQLWMWYSGYDVLNTGSLGLATSPDGIDWTKSAANPLLAGLEVMVRKEGVGDYKMWFGKGDGHIYRATSPDGLAWTADPATPVLSPTKQVGSWEKDGVWDPSIVQDGGGTYWMFYEGIHQEWDLIQIGVVTSTNGTDWTRVQTEPVLTPGAPGSWDEKWVLDPMVLWQGGAFRMWYSGRDGQGVRRIGYATSPDGLHWTKDTAHNPVFVSEPGKWEGDSVGNHFVLYDGEYGMWYSSGRGIGYVTSTDGLTWDRFLDKPVLEPGVPMYWGQPVVTLEDSYGRLDGFTITGGNAQSGGGILVRGGAPVIEGCKVAGNRAGEGGGGISVGYASPFIAHCTVANNAAGADGGGILIWDPASSGVFIGSTDVVDNDASNGGGIALLKGPRLLLLNSNVAGNKAQWGGGLSALGDVMVSVANSVIHQNIADESGGGLFVVERSLLTMTNSLVTGNEADSCGGVQFACCQAGGAATNVTVADNTASAGPGGVCHDDWRQPLSILNSIVYGNGHPNLVCQGGGCMVHYSDVEGGWAGTGNLGQDPHFVGGGDYHLAADSPCIDAGTAQGAPAYDLEWKPRSHSPDMGAYEWPVKWRYMPLVLKRFGGP